MSTVFLTHMKNHRPFLLALLLLAPAFLTGLASPATGTPADTIYVDHSAEGAETGETWTDAYPSLQDALGEATGNDEADDIWVAAGTYYPDDGSGVSADDRSATFRVDDGIHLYGHFSGNEYPPHIAEGRNQRFTSLGDYDSVRVVIEEGNSDEWLERATTVTQNVMEYFPVPTPEIDTLAFSEIEDVYDQRNGNNLIWVV